MRTLREWFTEFEEATNERPEFIVFGEFESWEDFKAERWVLPKGLVPFGDIEILDIEFDDGFGGDESPDFCAWSENWVLFSDNYDGSEHICWVPRHPKDHTPIRPGGG